MFADWFVFISWPIKIDFPFCFTFRSWRVLEGTGGYWRVFPPFLSQIFAYFLRIKPDPMCINNGFRMRAETDLISETRAFLNTEHPVTLCIDFGVVSAVGSFLLLILLFRSLQI
jgi:hypothetical protein